jgi:probable metal transport system ATP-binding protein TP_0035
LKKLNVENNLTIIAVEHNLDAAITNSTNIFHVANSKGHLCSPENYIKEFRGGIR